MGGAVPPIPQCAFLAWFSVRGSTGATLPFTFTLNLLKISFNYVSHIMKNERGLIKVTRN
jgi:hypothetical protein